MTIEDKTKSSEKLPSPAFAGFFISTVKLMANKKNHFHLSVNKQIRLIFISVVRKHLV